MCILSELCQKDKQWRNIALKITGNKQIADNLVQDMYVKMHNANPTKWNYTYVAITLNNLFKDIKKKEKYNLEIEDNKTTDLVETKDYSTKEIEVLNNIDKLTDYEKELLLMNYELSLGQIAKSKKRSRTTIHRHLSDARKKLLGNNMSGYVNSRLKYKKLE